MRNSRASALSSPLALFVLATFCCLLWGSAYRAIKQGYALFAILTHDVASQMVFAGVRFTAADLLLLLAALVMGWGVRMQRQNWSSIAMLGLSQTTLQYILFYIGGANATGSKSSIMKRGLVGSVSW